MPIIIRAARGEDSPVLTGISFAAKRFWNYPESYFDVWRDELTITPDYIEKHRVWLAEADGEIVGYYSIVHIPEAFQTGNTEVMAGYWLEHIFVKPAWIGQGIGRRLIEHVRGTCVGQGIEKLLIFSDPNATGFYERLGAEFIRDVPSSIEGRTVALYALHIGEGRGRSDE